MSILKKKAYSLLFDSIVKDVKDQCEGIHCFIQPHPLARSEFLAKLRESERTLTQLFEECPEIFQPENKKNAEPID